MGEYSIGLHEKVGKEVRKNKIDILICSGENSKYIINNSSTLEKYYLKNNEEILKKLQQILSDGDVVLVKASNGMKFYEICQKL